MAKKKKSSLRRRMVGAYVSSILSISLVLILVGTATLLLMNAKSVSDYFKENLLVSVILKSDVTEEEGARYAEELRKRPYVLSSKYIDQEQGTRELEALLGEDFLAVFEESPVPTSVELNLKAEYVAPDSLAVVTELLGEDEPVEDVKCQQGLVEALDSNMKKVSLILLIAVAALLFISLILINNVVRLHVFAKRFSISTMKLVGATHSFICRPFLKRAVLQGFMAALLAILALAGLLYWLNSALPQLLAIVQVEMFVKAGGVVLASGLVICVVGTYFYVNKLLSMSKNELYG